MLKRQQAGAVLAARTSIVHGAVGMVVEAIKQMDANGEQVTNEQKANMAHALMMVLISDDNGGSG